MLGGDAVNKTMVMGVVERKGGRIVAWIAPRLTIPSTNELLREYVMRKTMIFTDDAGAYNELAELKGMGYVHRRIKHSQKVYVRGDVHDQAPVLYSEVDLTHAARL